MIFIYSKLLCIFCFIILFTSSSPCRKDQLPFHIYFSTKYCFMFTYMLRRVMGIAAQSLEAVKRLFSFYTQCLQGCNQGVFFQ